MDIWTSLFLLHLAHYIVPFGPAHITWLGGRSGQYLLSYAATILAKREVFIARILAKEAKKFTVNSIQHSIPNGQNEFGFQHVICIA
jgi:hypothetical protein